MWGNGETPQEVGASSSRGVKNGQKKRQGSDESRRKEAHEEKVTVGAKEWKRISMAVGAAGGVLAPITHLGGVPQSLGFCMEALPPVLNS